MSELFKLLGWAFLAAPLAKLEGLGALAGRTESCSDEQLVATSKSSESVGFLAQVWLSHSHKTMNLRC
jgi:hypothetical protein